MMPSYQFFIRPRRFGKSLFLSMLETYYDINEKEKFEHYFGDKYIGKNKTDKANEYLILILSFAGIVTDRGVNEIVSGIDEYDNFANGLIIKDKEMYKELVQTDGYIKSFYKEIKEGTAEGVIARTFITGVSPVLLDDLTSGANIFENISNEKMLSSMMGVTKDELQEDSKKPLKKMIIITIGKIDTYYEELD